MNRGGEPARITQAGRITMRSRSPAQRLIAGLGDGWRIFSSSARNYLANDDWLWASALTYTVALSIVPLLVLGFAVLKGLGELSQLEPVILHYLSLDSPEIRYYLHDFIANSRAGALGSLGGGSLLIFDIMTLWTIEIAFNRIWRVQDGRPFARKVSDYISVTVTVPILLALALTLSGWLGNVLAEIPLASTITPLVLVWIGYAFLFLFFPYTTVRYRPALIGSFITAMLWLSAYWAYVHFQYAASYTPVYGALAAIPGLLVWIYLSWSIVLFGAEISASLQYGTSHAAPRELPPDFARRAALLIMIRLGERMMNRRGPVMLRETMRELGVSEAALKPVLHGLKSAGFIAEGKPETTNPENYELLLARAPDEVTIDAILASVEQPGPRRAYDRRIATLLSHLAENEKSSLKGQTLRDLLGDQPHAL
jgi:membrane protein